MHPTPALVLLLAAALGAQETQNPPKIPRQPSGGREAPAVTSEVQIPDAPMPLGMPTPALAEPAAPMAADATIPAFPVREDRVRFDRGADGTLWAAAAGWKASFDGTAATFVPFLGSTAPTNYPARFAVSSVHAGGVAIEVSDGVATEQGQTISIGRGGMVEQYVASTAGIEQKFVFDRLPTRGLVAVTIGVDSGYAVTAENGGYRFTCAHGSFTYGTATAFDANGRSTPVASEWTGNAIRLTVPESFVANASLPLVIDPLIGNTSMVFGPSTQLIEATDIAFDASLNEYLAVREQAFSLADSDVYAQRFDAAMQPIGGPLTIDFSGTSWRACRIAGLNLYNKFLIVAECQVGANATYVAGRIVDANGWTLGSTFDIEHGAVACSSPDVGGDPSLIGPVFWTVVYERHYSANDHDVVIRQVQSDAVLRGTSYTSIGTSVDNERAPVISNSNGADGSFSTQRWCIAFWRDLGFNTTIRTSTVAWDGVVDPVQTVSGGYPVQDSADLTVSSPTLASMGRNFMVATTRYSYVFNLKHIHAAVVGNGVVVAPLTEAIDYNTEQGCPVADTDGRRFALAYTRRPTLANPYYYLATHDLVGSTLVLREVRSIGPSSNLECRHSLCSEISGGAGRQRRYGGLWVERTAAGDLVHAANYAGVASPGGATIRPTGCGTFGITVPAHYDFAAIGGSIHIDATNNTGLMGWGFGVPVSAPLPGCGACMIGTTADAILIGATLDIPVPFNVNLVGALFACQSFRIGFGTCLGDFEFSDTVDVTIR